MNKILVIQTAFIGDVILATGVLEKLHQFYPKAQIDFLVRKGNEELLHNHPFIHKTLIWNKNQSKYKNLIHIIRTIRKTKYDAVFNLQRFAASGFVTVLSGAQYTSGFDKNPLSFAYSCKVPHVLKSEMHELDRNQLVIAEKTTQTRALPRLYPSAENFERVKKFKENPYVVIAPASVWFTKQVPVSKWVELIKKLSAELTVYLIGSKSDLPIATDIVSNIQSLKVINLCGQLSLLESAALMKDAKMNYVNDSAPMHMAGAVQAPVTALYCSTLPSFGFAPFLPNGQVLQTEEKLTCRPCGLHGKRSCPEGHFRCATTLKMDKIAV